MMDNFFTNIDLIAIPVAMNMFGREKSKTRFGGLCSVLFFGFVAWAIYNCSQDLLSTLNPKVVSYEHYNGDPRALTISRESFPVAFAMQASGLYNYTPFKDESIYTVEIYHNLLQYIKRPDGSRDQKWTVTRVRTEACTREHFASQETSFSDFGLETSYCIAKDQPQLQKLEIQGVFSSWTYQDISVRIFACKNSTSNNTCASPEKIDSYMTGSWFNALYANMVVNPQNYSHPNATYKDMYFTMIGPSDYRETFIELGHVEVSTDKGWLTEEMNTKSYIKVNHIREFLQTKPHKDKMFIKCNFRMSQLETYYTRSYKKIQAVLAEVASLASAALAVLVIVTSPFLRMKFRESLMNQLFDVQLPQKQNKKRASKKTQENKNSDIKKEFNKIILQEAGPGLKHHLPDYKPLDTVQMKSPISSSRPLMLEGFDNEDKIKSPQHPFPIKPVQRIEKDPKEDIEHEPEVTQSNSRRDYASKQSARTMVDKDTKAITTAELALPLEKVRQMKFDLQTETKLIPKSTGAQVEMKSIEDEESLHISFSDAVKEDLEQEENDNDLPEDTKGQEEPKSDEKTPIDFETVKTKDSQTRERPTLRLKFKKKAKIIDNKESERMDIGLWEYIQWILCKSRSMKPKAEVFDEGMKSVNERLEIVNILKKIGEIDNLRALLFDADQLLLFNSLPKHAIRSKRSDFHRKTTLSNTLLENRKFIQEKASEEEILRSLRNLNNKAEKTQIDKRLIQIFEDQLK